MIRKSLFIASTIAISSFLGFVPSPAQEARCGAPNGAIVDLKADACTSMGGTPLSGPVPCRSSNGAVVQLDVASCQSIGGKLMATADPRIAAVIENGSKTIERVITRARDLSGTASTDGVGQDDIKVLQPMVTEAAAALGDNPDSRELANLYARGQFLVFEREFAALFNRPDPNGEFLKQANRQAVKLRSTLDRISHQLPAQPASGDQDTLKTAADLADMASVLVGYRSFSRQFPQVGKPGEQAATPTPEQIAAIDGRKKDFIQYSKTYHQILTRDYRLFNALVQDVENRDFALVNRWQNVLGSAK